MDIHQRFSINRHILYTFAVLLIYLAGDYPVATTTDSLFETSSENPGNNEENLKNILNCVGEAFSQDDVIFLNGSDIVLKTKNITVHSSDYQKIDEKVFVWHDSLNNSKNKLITDCTRKFAYYSDEFQAFPNCSVLLYDEIVLPGEYELKNDTLVVCDLDDTHEHNSAPSLTLLKKVSTSIYKIGSGISIVALIIHLSIFCNVPALQNLPGCNLASLSVALIFAYFSVIIAQTEGIPRLFCVILGVIQLNLSLVSYFCMNVLAFDIWRTLTLGNEKLILVSSNIRKRQFLWYSLYAWGIPLVISFVSVLLDYINGVPEKFKPYFGRLGICWMTNNTTITVFFVVPSCILFIINTLFFILSYIIISNSTMKCTNDHHKEATKFNFVLYVRLGLIMGLTRLTAVFGVIFQNDIVWIIHDLLNSLQGLFLLLLFACTKKSIETSERKIEYLINIYHHLKSRP